ncbi:helix-turn-helix domain-containing protein [Variovorax sp. PAMC 28711]|uniref:helix-turn-helix domain-containing protein n=1 Tax=Variovorax sp. PAMC 28711 TaxID=1795631 RepID=UPI00078EA62A|nr:helix-turn-helix transcriptional regulator [Variovorax sp. PAMC 28711]AMM23016.1 XRE family transcriptional regulator [Variovorax sp. PAMC 28711]
MNPIKAIRERLGVTQAELAQGMNCSQSNVSFYEKGQTVPPQAAKALIAFAAEREQVVTFDQIYADSTQPAA